MTAKEYLNQAYHIDHRIESKLSQIESLKNLATRVTSVFSDMPHSSSPDNQRLQKTIAEIVDLENEVSTDIGRLVSLKREIKNIINQVQNEKYRTLLELRYLNFWTWEQIAVDLNFSIQHTYRIHDEALKKISIFLKDESKCD